MKTDKSKRVYGTGQSRRNITVDKKSVDFLESLSESGDNLSEGIRKAADMLMKKPKS